MENIKSVSNEELLASLKKMRGGECQVVADIVSYLAEVDTRRVYRDYGYSSLHTFCVNGLGYSEGSAYRRIAAARCLRDNVEVYDLLKEGKVSLCSLSEVAKIITPENKVEVLTLSQGLPKRAAEKLVAHYLPPAKSKRDVFRVKRVVAPVIKSGSGSEITSTVEAIEKYTLGVELDKECGELLERAKEISGEFKLGELLKVVLGEFVKRREPKPVKEKRKVAGAPAEKRVAAAKPENQGRAVQSRYIVRQVRDEVRVRDGQQCSFRATDGTRCTEKCGLEFDHAEPFARGGGREADNLRLVCPAHNQLLAERSFGKGFMDRKRQVR